MSRPGGGHRTHIVCMGEGAPTVILEAGIGSTLSQWAWVQPGIAKFAHVCSYDRAGLGGSQPAPGRRDGLKIAEDLSALLAVAGKKPPYIVVGHSLGGLFARVFASLYPDQVAGLLLIDPTPLMLELSRMQRFAGRAMVEALPLLNRFGIQPLRAQMEHLGQGMPDQARKELITAYGSSSHLAGFRSEFRAMNTSIAEAKAATLSPNLEVVVLSASRPMAASQQHLVRQAQAEHRQFAEGFAHGRHRIIENSNHLSLVIEQKYADQIVEETEQLIRRLSDRCPTDLHRRLL